MFFFVCKMCTNTNLLLNSQWIGGAGEGKEREEENYNPVKWRAKKTRGRQKQIGNYSKGDRFLMAASGVLAGEGNLPPIYARNTNKST
jgi:hypothetical protein